MKELNLSIDEEAANQIEAIAKDNGLSLKRFCELILEMFPEDGNLYWGAWFRGGPGARRFVIDWPKFSSPVIKLKKEELK
ncbi:MAG: hypothetical protein HWN66_08930 [Candidatus Helarchaeota archaeon]|nr:hypothetical protein [Candidatus Helarchaeota archaeon]